MLRNFVPAAARLPCFVLVIATLTASVTMMAEAFAFSVYAKVALFLQLVVTNCMILGRLEQFASRQPAPRAILDALGTAAGFALALLALAVARAVPRRRRAARHVGARRLHRRGALVGRGAGVGVAPLSIGWHNLFRNAFNRVKLTPVSRLEELDEGCATP